MKSEKEWAELLKYSSPKELYIITWNNLLKKLFCPFNVIVLNDIGDLIEEEVVQVDEVKITFELKTVYLIKGRYYFYHYFDIIYE